MKRLLIIVIAALLGVAISSAFARRQDVRRGREFADQAAAVRKTTEDAVTFLSYAGARGRAPAEDEFVIWERRIAAAEAGARAAAGRLRTRRKRDAVLRWIAAQEALRSARVASRAIVVSRILYDYCTERQQFVARVVQTFPAPRRMAALRMCFDQSDGDQAPDDLREETARLEAEERAAWALLLRVVPEAAR